MHERTWQTNRYVYAVVSRRAKGLSIGVNLNPDKVCNFDCIYCSVDRRSGEKDVHSRLSPPPSPPTTPAAAGTTASVTSPTPPPPLIGRMAIPPAPPSLIGGTPIPPAPPFMIGGTPIPPAPPSMIGGTPIPPAPPSLIGGTPTPPAPPSLIGGTPIPRDVDLAVLRAELAAMLELARSGELYRLDPFDKIPAPLRRLNDIAFSGDGEPTTCPEFAGACELAIELRESFFPATPGALARAIAPKLVTITNATMFHQPAVREALGRLDRHGGEVWAKLDAGTEAYYELVDRTTIPLQRVLENILWAARTLGQDRGGIVIQSLFMKVHGVPPAREEIAAFVDRLGHVLNEGGRLKLVQVYTVARGTTEAYATALTEGELEEIAGAVTGRLKGLAVEVYP